MESKTPVIDEKEGFKLKGERYYKYPNFSYSDQIDYFHRKLLYARGQVHRLKAICFILVVAIIAGFFMKDGWLDSNNKPEKKYISSKEVEPTKEV